MPEFFNNHKKWFYFAGILIFIYVLFFLNLGNYELLDLDETRYVNMSRYMHNAKDFLTLYLNGDYFFEKPPLYFWLENASFFVLKQINEFTARIPGVLESLLASIALYFGIKKVTKNTTFALCSSLVLLTEVEYLILSKIAILDILLANTVFASIYCAIATLFVKQKHKIYFWWGFYIFCALAILAKGIPGLVLPFASTFFIGLYTKNIKEYFKKRYIIVGSILFLAVVLPWHIIMFKMHDPLFFNEYIIKHHIMRFLGGSVIHRDEPWWFYFITLLWGMVPYTHSFFALLYEKLKDIKNFKFKKFLELDNEEKLTMLCAICAIVIFLFFSSSKTKLVTYILPIYPFLAVILGRYWAQYVKNDEHKKPLEITSAVLSSILLLAGLIAPFIFNLFDEPLKSDLIYIQNPMVWGVVFFSLISLISIKKGKRLALFLSYVALIAFLSGFCFHEFLKMDYRFGQKDLMEFAKIIYQKKYNIYTFETGLKYSLNYYAGKNAKFDIKAKEIARVLKNKNNILIVRKKDLAKIKAKYRILKDGRKFILLHK